MARDRGGEHPRVVMARLLVLRHRTDDADAMLAEFVEHHPDSPTAQRSLGRLRAGMYFGTGADVFDDSRNSEIRDAVGHDDQSKYFSDTLSELFRRGSLATEFCRARIAEDPARKETDLIRQEALKGDPLAGFYSQWLMPEDTLACPPHAWAWNACRYWQKSACRNDWQHLVTQFPRGCPGDGVPTRPCHNGRRRPCRCYTLARSPWIRQRYGTPSRCRLYARSAERTGCREQERTRGDRRRGDGMRGGGRFRTRAGTGCLRLYTSREAVIDGRALINTRGGNGVMNQIIVSTEYDKPPDFLVRQEEIILDVTERLTQALDDAGVTKTELAKRLGKSPGYVSQVLGGGRLRYRCGRRFDCRPTARRGLRLLLGDAI